MKCCLTILVLLLFSSCSTLKLTNTEYNKDFSPLQLDKILVIGVSPDDELRREFEFKFVQQMQKHKVNALQSAAVFESYFKDSEQTEDELMRQIEILKSNGYDTVLITMVKGVDDNTSFSSSNVKMDYYLRHFLGYNLMFQDASYDNRSYNEYQVYHIQSTVYKLKTDSEMSLIWSGSYDIINPKKSSKTINKYIKAVMKSLEKEQLIYKK